jgi:PAS domain S-box-containing protein
MAGSPDLEALFKPAILVIDDEGRIRDGCCKVMTQEGFDVATAECGERGLSMIEEKHYDIILLDLMMPNISGFDVLSRVKSVAPDSVVIVITGYATLEHSIEAMKRGAFDFIPKPFSPDQLRAMVTKAMAYTRTLRDIANEKSRMRRLINHLTDGVMATDSNKQIVLANPAFLRMVGYRGNGVVGRQVNEILQNEKVESIIERALSEDPQSFCEQTEELTLNEETVGGQGLTLCAKCIPFRDRVGRNLGSITVLHDISAQKKMDQIRSEFVSMVAHEIRSPLNSILAQLHVVLDGLAGDVAEKQQSILNSAAERIKSLVNLSTELLDLFAIESGLIVQKREPVDVAEVMEDQLAFHSPRASEEGIGLEMDQPAAPLPPVLANRRNIEEVLSNLIGNAITYTPKGGRILISAGKEGGYLRISISDTGFGIPEEEIDKIFAPFYRVKNEKTRFIIGTGLGLAIVKKIVDSLDGYLRVESVCDKGSTFHVHLPLLLG